MQEPGCDLYQVLKNGTKDYETYIYEAQKCKDWSNLEVYCKLSNKMF